MQQQSESLLDPLLDTVPVGITSGINAAQIVLSLVVGAMLMLLSVGLYGAFHFAEDAITKAGDTPPKHVALQLESLRRWQGLANVTLVLAAMGAAAASMGHLGSNRKWFVSTAIWPFVLGSLMGCVAGVSGWLLFRLRPMGDQNLVIAALIQAVTWGILGFGVALAMAGFSRQPLMKIGPAVAFPAMWGLVVPAILTLLFPTAYVGTVIPNEVYSRMLWGGVGGVVLIMGAVRCVRTSENVGESIRTC